MDELKNSFEYEFVGGLTYIKDGEPVQAKSITIKAPNNRLLREVSIIEQEYEKAQMSIAKSFMQTMDQEAVNKLMELNAEKKAEKTITPEEENSAQTIIKNLMSSDADMPKCYDALKKILLSSNDSGAAALIDDKEKMTQPIFNDMNVIDTKNILGEYIVNFTIASQAV